MEPPKPVKEIGKSVALQGVLWTIDGGRVSCMRPPLDPESVIKALFLTKNIMADEKKNGIESLRQKRFRKKMEAVLPQVFRYLKEMTEDKNAKRAGTFMLHIPAPTEKDEALAQLVSELTDGLAKAYPVFSKNQWEKIYRKGSADHVWRPRDLKKGPRE